jgi:alpha-mannosidase
VPWPSASGRKLALLALLALPIIEILATSSVFAQQKRVYMAPDDHTDYFWSGTDVEYQQFFLTMLDYYLDQADATANEPTEFQSRFSADGSLWLREYEKKRTPAAFQRLVDRLKSGHISAPLNPLVITYGGVPAEAVIRSMYYAGQLERRYGLEFLMGIALENATHPFGLSSLWAGSGAKFSWNGICNCPSLISEPTNRPHEIYRSIGPDGQGVIMKWFSLHGVNGNQDLGGYAEARFPDTVFDEVTINASSNGFAARYPFDTIGVFGQGWDDLSTTNLNIQQTCKTKSDSTRLCIVSNMTDFFQEFATKYGARLPSVAASFGNEWDLAPASLAEVSARVKRSLEKLRSAEALATLVSLKSSSFLNGREAARDTAFLDFGLFFEHDFENGGPRVSGDQRIAWQRKVAGEIETYTNTLMVDAVNALGAMIESHSSNPRFFVFNSLSWTRNDIADIPYSGALPVRVIDLALGAEVPSQIVNLAGRQYIRIAAQEIPSVGYKVFEIQAGSGQTFPGAPTANATTGVMENEFYKIVVSPRGAITSFIDKRLSGLELAGNTGEFALNDLGPGSGSLRVENAGAVSTTLVASSSAPLAHTTRITLTRGSDRVAIQNEVTQNFGGTQLWRFSVNVSSPDVRHEEVGAIARARITTDGGNYSPVNARYDYLTLNHFADMSGTGSVGITVSNQDAYFMKLGASTPSSLDTATPQLSVVLGSSARPSNPILNQAGDSYFLQRFALQSHGSFSPAAAMRFSLEHQNPLVVGQVSGGTEYPEMSYSFVSISNPNVLLWSLKPSEEGIGEGVITRVWNVAPTSSSFSLALNGAIGSAKQIEHIETDKQDAALSGGQLTSAIAQDQLLSFRVFPSSLPPAVKIVPSDARLSETGDSGSFTIVRTGSTATALAVRYAVGGTATPGTDYQTLSGTANFPAGASSTVIPLIPIADSVNEAEETISVTLLPEPNIILGSWNNAVASLLNGPPGGPNPGPLTATLYPLSEGSGTITADVSGNGNTGALNGSSSWVTGKYGNGIHFDGYTGNISVMDASSLDLGNAGTIAAWVKLDSLNRWHSVIAKGDANYNEVHNYALEIDNSNRFMCILGNGASWVAALSSTSAVSGRFYHVACTWDGTSLRLYVDGASSASITQTFTPAGNPSPLYIGQFGGNADRLQGVIDEVRIYNQALDQAQIVHDMNTPIEDSAAPSVSITAPNDGSQVSGTIPVTASASDNVGVVGVQFQVDGVNLGAEDTSAPYSIDWNTAAAANGSHTLSAVARDAAGNKGTAATVMVTVNNDTVAPSVPTALTATAVSSTQINLAWAASSDNVGVAGYRVTRNGSAIANTTATSYQNTGLAPSTTYRYTVAAFDAAANFSGESTPASATTPAGPAGGPVAVASYAFGENAGTVTADGSGNGNQGTLVNGPQWTTGKYGPAIAFDGINDYVAAPDSNSLDLAGAGTIEAWVKLDAVSRWNSVIAKGNANNNALHNYALEITNGNQFMCILGNGSESTILYSNNLATTGTFYHLACVWNGADLQLYVNGVLNASTAQNLTPAGNSAPLYIGQFGGNVDQMAGVIDEVRVYNRALTQAQIQNDMNTPL